MIQENKNIETTANILYNCLTKGGQLPIQVIKDFFGKNCKDKDTVELIDGIYTGLVKYKGVSAELLNKCFLTNRLDELIHTKYSHWTSGYYKEFVEKEIKIGPTHDTGTNICDFDIPNGDQCSNCLKYGFITEDNAVISECQRFCSNCDINLCSLCFCTYKDDFYCTQCVPEDVVEQRIKRKIKDAKIYDKQRFKTIGDLEVKDIIKLLEKQGNKCWNCKDIVLILGWKPFCCYQFSIDRIDDSKPHNKDNIQISCYYCNCRHHPDFDQYNKVCKQGCHTISRPDISSKYHFLKCSVCNKK